MMGTRGIWWSLVRRPHLESRELSHLNKIRKTFSEQAKGLGNTSLTLAREGYLKWMIELLPIAPHYEVLDVAAGAGHLSRAIAPLVKKVTAIDVTPEMLAEGNKEARKAVIQNIVFKVGNAESLPFEGDAFDLVVSRFAIHHFTEPSRPLAEMARVCKPSGFVGIIDMVAPQDTEMAQKYNYWEQVRDPSHTLALSPEAFAGLISGAGLAQARCDSREIEIDVDRWINLTKPGEKAIKEIREAIEQDIAGKGPTGLRPFVQDDDFKFWQTWMIVVGKKEHS